MHTKVLRLRSAMSVTLCSRYYDCRHTGSLAVPIWLARRVSPEIPCSETGQCRSPVFQRLTVLQQVGGGAAPNEKGDTPTRLPTRKPKSAQLDDAGASLLPTMVPKLSMFTVFLRQHRLTLLSAPAVTRIFSSTLGLNHFSPWLLISVERQRCRERKPRYQRMDTPVSGECFSNSSTSISMHRNANNSSSPN